ncbi:J domain-containing protein [Ramlibacter sp. WS9]|nr:J domain-containing protein [Ramlibacter sp. WS9]
MDESRAREILGVRSDAAVEEIEAAFRKLASVKHPDKGGSAEEMAEVIAARDRLGELQRQLVPVEMVRELVRVLADQNASASTKQHLKSLREDFQQRSTNRLKERRKMVAIVAAAAAAVTLFGKDLPIDDFVELSTGAQKQELQQAKKALDDVKYPTPIPAPAPLPTGTARQESPEEKAFETAKKLADSKRDLLAHRVEVLEQGIGSATRMKSALRVAAAGLAMGLGMLAWMLSQRIGRTESELEDFDERTETRAGFVEFLGRVFADGRFSTDWSEWQLVRSLDETKDFRVRQLCSQVGSHSFARYIIRRGVSLDFLSAQESVDGGFLEERYTLKRGRAA